MATLKYKTRGNSSPKGKPRVYFCCHKDDFEKFFESISDEVLSLQNCSVWYKDVRDYVNEELLDDLKEMQLFVMPVTANLLCTENDALDIEFKFAIEKHIPVLPLMQEPGLEQIFNLKCGELQFLDKHNTDITAISYEEKLNKYLESVLIGDEMAEKIRAAFDAYVFLSYRKKDRKYAQELMRLIHKNEFCRDIAIWYDEFLTPGENFNDSIKEALQKSGLFVLTVTPNLVNEVNYIMTTEYPMAKQEGKPILPAELVPTDREELSQKYEDIPAVSDAHNDSELSDALLESIKKMAIKENDKDTKHNFFIGLAYLDGIDVEVDYPRAVNLIAAAAEENLIEAMKKLVAMYKSGKGVEVDYLIALKWQYRVTKKFLEKFEKENTVESFLEYYQELLQYVGDLYEERGSGAYELGASKVLEDGVRLINKYEREILKDIKSTTQLKEITETNEMLITITDSKKRLRFFGDRFLPKTWRAYCDLLDYKNEEINTGQAIIRYLLSYYSEYSGNMEECLQERKECEEIIAKCALANGESETEIKQKVQEASSFERLISFVQHH